MPHRYEVVAFNSIWVYNNAWVYGWKDLAIDLSWKRNLSRVGHNLLEAKAGLNTQVCDLWAGGRDVCWYLGARWSIFTADTCLDSCLVSVKRSILAEVRSPTWLPERHYFSGIFSLLEHLASRIIGFSQRVAGLIYDANWRDSWCELHVLIAHLLILSKLSDKRF